MNEKYLRKITIRIYDRDMAYLKAHPIQDIQNKRLVPLNEFLREVIHNTVNDVKKLRGH